MKSHLLFILTFGCVFLHSCNQTNKVKNTEIDKLKPGSKNQLAQIEYIIDNTNIPEFADISSIVDTVKIIPLIEEPGNNIVDLWSIIPYKDYYVAYDKVQNKILLFSRGGTFIRSIIKTGIGPDEALSVADCWVAANRQLEVYDFTLKKKYTFDTLFQIESSVRGNLETVVTQMTKIPRTKKYIGFSGYYYNPQLNNSCYRVAFFDENLNLVNTALPYDCKFQGVDLTQLRFSFFQHKDSLRFINNYDNFIYHVADGSLLKLARISYSKNEIPEDFLYKTLDKNIEYFKQQLNPQAAFERSSIFKKYAYLQGCIESELFLYVISHDLPGYHVAIINKGERNSIYTAQKFAEQNRFKVVLPRFDWYDPYSDSFIGYVYGFKMLKENLLPGSVFINKIKIEPSRIYLFSVKLKK